MIELRLFATFREGRGKVIMLDSGKFGKTSEIIDELKIPAGEVSILLINGRHRDLDYPLNDGDVVALFPPVGGG